MADPDEGDTGRAVYLVLDGAPEGVIGRVVGGDDAPLVAVSDPRRLEDEPVAEVVECEVRDGDTGGGVRPVRVEDERVVGAVEDLGLPVGLAVTAGQAVGVVLGVVDGLGEFVERASPTGDVVDAPERVAGDVTGEGANLRLRVGGEDVGNGVGPWTVFEGEDEFAHTGA